jgi:hypothetical protein
MRNDSMRKEKCRSECQTRRGVFWGLTLAFLLQGAYSTEGLASLPNGCKPTDTPLGGGSGGIPGGLEANKKVELGEGEFYMLDGRLEWVAPRVLGFYVNFESHPWLENKRRTAEPYYILWDSGSQGGANLLNRFRKYVGKPVNLSFWARYGVLETERGYELRIVAQPASTPTGLLFRSQ